MISMAMECYVVAHNYLSCAQNCVMLRKHRNWVWLFPAKASLEFVVTNILVEHMEVPRRNKYLVEIMDRFSKLVKAALFRPSR